MSKLFELRFPFFDKDEGGDPPPSNDDGGTPKGTEKEPGEGGEQKKTEPKDTVLGGGKADDEGDGEPGGKTTGAPEKYELKLPENRKFDEATLADAETLFREAGLSNEAAQKLIDLQVKQLDQQETAWVEAVEAWGKEIQQDRDFGGDKFEATTRRVRALVDRFGDDEVKHLLNESGYGNHPGLVKMFARLAQALGEDGDGEARRAGGPNPQQKASWAGDPSTWPQEVLDKQYPTMAKKDH